MCHQNTQSLVTALKCVQQAHLEITLQQHVKIVSQTTEMIHNGAGTLFSAVPTTFGVKTNASAFYVAFDDDLQNGTVVLNFSVLLDLNHIGTLQHMFLSFTRTPLLESFFGFDNRQRTKDVVLSDINVNSENIGSLDEQLFFKQKIDESIFTNGVATFDLELSVVVLGTNTLTTIEYDTIVYFTVTSASKQGERRSTGVILYNVY